MSREYPWGKGTPKWTRDAAANNSDKSYTVPAGKIWVWKGLRAYLLATATVGNRVLSVRVTDGTNVIWATPNSANIAASASHVYILGESVGSVGGSTAGNAPKDDNTTATSVTYSNLPMSFMLPAGYVIRVLDTAAIDAAADDLTVVLHYIEYDA